MKRKIGYVFVLITIVSVSISTAWAQQGKQYALSSPDKKITIQVSAGKTLTWSVTKDNTMVLQPSAVSLQLGNGEMPGKDVSVTKAITSSVNDVIHTSLYKKSSISDNYNQVLIHCKGNWGIIFRAYNDGVAYRFFTEKKDSITVVNEEAGFQFTKDFNAYLPHALDPRVKGDLYSTSFEALYNETPISKLKTDSLVFLPVLVDLENGEKA